MVYLYKNDLAVGWFSPTQRNMSGQAVYRHENGEEVVVTEIKPVGENPTHSDAVKVGLVSSFVRFGPQFYGWFSQKMMEMKGRIVHYIDMNGNEVPVTCVTRTRDHGIGWDDVQYQGLLMAFSRVEYVNPSNIYTPSGYISRDYISFAKHYRHLFGESLTFGPQYR